MKKAVITILGIQGGYVNNDTAIINNFDHKALYYFEGSNDKKEYFNIIPLLLDKYSNNYEIVPIFTKEAKIFNQKVLQEYNNPNYKLKFSDSCFIEDDKNFDAIFHLMHKTIENYDEVIVDVTHGFRHLPLLMLVELIIQNFSNTNKIKKILFAKEITKHAKEKQGVYEVIDLKRYAQLANISFILENFEKNYTVANHIHSTLYKDLITALNDFSEDIMALNLKNLYSQSAKKLIKELKDIKHAPLQEMSIKLAQHIEELVAINGKKRYQSYYDLAYDLFEKNYILLSLALLYESIRMYIKSYIKKKHPQIVEDVEKQLKGDLYKIGFFFKNLSWKDYEKFRKDYKSRFEITKENYNKLQKSFPKEIEGLYKDIDRRRNNLAHANSGKRFKEIKDDVERIFNRYYNLCIKEKKSSDLVSHFQGR